MIRSNRSFGTKNPVSPLVRSIFSKLSRDGETINVEGFRLFREKTQKEAGTVSEVRQIFQSFGKCFLNFANEYEYCMDIDDFNEYLSKSNIIDERNCERVNQDMSRPMTDYWISSSHNTYLEGAQIGLASTKGYGRALRLGYRCVELDCYNGSEGEPVVRHGHASTAVSFKQVLRAIEANAFATSAFPVCLSLEIHADCKHQRKMADTLRHIFGQKLISPENPVQCSNRACHPSPDEMKYRIFVKGNAETAESSLARLIIYTKTRRIDVEDSEYWKREKDFHFINSLSSFQVTF